MAELTRERVIECFHLAFLQVLGARVKRGHYVLKGGANLRYFFDSHRYSEDIDFDALTDEGWKLEEQVDAVLAAPAVGALLRSKAVSITHVGKPKQTQTTRRWKVLLDTPKREGISAKIEFSRRDSDARRSLDPVPSRIVSNYGLRPPTLLHYTAPAATEQKVRALALRTETQARDVFDLDLLFRAHPDAVAKGAVRSATLDDAAQRCVELPFEAFRAQVIPFIEPDVADLYDDVESWQQMQSFVVDRLMELDNENN